MKIVFLDAQTIGSDIDLSVLKDYGDFTSYPNTAEHEINSRALEADIIITNKVPLRAELIKNLPNLKMIIIAATGIDPVDVDFASSQGIKVKNAINHSTDSVAQHTLALALSLLRNIPAYKNFTESGGWDKSQVYTCLDFNISDLKNKTWGIIGLGNIGKKVSDLVKVFGANIQYYSTTGKNNNSEVKQVNLEELLKTSDIISIHCPLNNTTRNLINEEALKLIKNNTVIINVARGGIINETALVNYFDKKNLYLGIDVVSIEPMTSNNELKKIISSPRVIITPHMAWGSKDTRLKLLEIIKRHIEKFKESTPTS